MTGTAIVHLLGSFFLWSHEVLLPILDVSQQIVAYNPEVNFYLEIGCDMTGLS
jgi:hypothetical protein